VEAATARDGLLRHSAGAAATAPTPHVVKRARRNSYRSRNLATTTAPLTIQLANPVLDKAMTSIAA
jgi:hypothetical protein